jgi:hypothetical protein
MASPMDDISDITLPSSDEAHLPLESVSHDAKQNDSKRVVTVVTVPVKDSEVISRKITTLLIRLFGSQLTWAMHWAILVGGTAFELKRPRGRAKPYLGVSIWPDEKLKDIVTSFPLGFTTFSDEEILRAGMLLIFFLIFI